MTADSPGRDRRKLCGAEASGRAPLLRPEERALAAMLEGWRVQQLARSLAFSTVSKRLTAIAAFTAHADAFPWGLVHADAR